jgi:hypothetical protein
MDNRLKELFAKLPAGLPSEMRLLAGEIMVMAMESYDQGQADFIDILRSGVLKLEGTGRLDPDLKSALTSVIECAAEAVKESTANRKKEIAKLM